MSPSTPAKDVFPWMMHEQHCTIDAIADGTGVNWHEARAAALNHGYDPMRGMDLRETHSTLLDLGITANYHAYQPSTWSQFPERAIIAVRGPTGVRHAVVLNGEYVIDGNNGSYPVPRSNYSLWDGYGQSYISLAR